MVPTLKFPAGRDCPGEKESLMCSTSSCGPRSGFGWRRFHRHAEAFGWGGDFMPHGQEGFGFGVRRPLRFLAYKLELDDRQVAELARLLDELKTERAQGEVDDRRTLADFADALAG